MNDSNATSDSSTPPVDSATNVEAQPDDSDIEDPSAHFTPDAPDNVNDQTDGEGV